MSKAVIQDNPLFSPVSTIILRSLCVHRLCVSVIDNPTYRGRFSNTSHSFPFLKIGKVVSGHVVY